MGRGGYNGGSTIVHPGTSWFSGGGRRPPRKVTTPCSPEALEFLKLVVASRRFVPEVPKTMSEELAREISRAGGPFEWARTRREYDALQPRRTAPTNKAKKTKNGNKASGGTKATYLLPAVEHDAARVGGGMVPSERLPEGEKVTGKVKLTERARVEYLSALVSAIVRQIPLPRPPKEEPANWRVEALEAPEQWAAKQPEYARLLARFKRRVAKEQSQ